MNLIWFYFKLAKIENEGNAPLHKLMEDLGGLPILGSAPGGGWDSTTYSIEDLLVKSFQITNYVPIISIMIVDFVKIQNSLLVRFINTYFSTLIHMNSI